MRSGPWWPFAFWDWSFFSVYKLFSKSNFRKFNKGKQRRSGGGGGRRIHTCSIFIERVEWGEVRGERAGTGVENYHAMVRLQRWIFLILDEWKMISGGIYNANLSPEHKQQRKHLPRYFAFAVVASVDDFKRFFFHSLHDTIYTYIRIYYLYIYEFYFTVPF